VILLAITAILFWGCSHLGSRTPQFLALHYPGPTESASSPIPETLMVYKFLLANNVDLHSLVISKAEDKDGALLRLRWEENPADMVTDLILRDLENSKLFEKTVDQLSSARYRYALEGTILDLRGTIRNGKALGLLVAEASLIDFEPPPGGKRTLMKKSYKIEVPTLDGKPTSMVRAMNTAVRRLSEQIRTDIRASVEKTDNSDTGSDKNLPIPAQSPVKISQRPFQPENCRAPQTENENSCSFGQWLVSVEIEYAATSRTVQEPLFS